MDSSRKITQAILLIALLVVTSETADGKQQIPPGIRPCFSKSQKWKGACLKHKNCASVCQTEGFPAGRCHPYARPGCWCATAC